MATPRGNLTVRLRPSEREVIEQAAARIDENVTVLIRQLAVAGSRVILDRGLVQRFGSTVAEVR